MRARPLAGLLVAAVMAGASACGDDPGPDDELDNTLLGHCDPDDSISIATATSATLAPSADCKPGEVSCVSGLADALCPRLDADFWRVSVSAGSLLQVDVSYEKLSNMRLAVAVYGPDSDVPLATQVEPSVTSTLHRVRASFSAATAGDYVVKVFDQVNVVDDGTTRYTLHIGVKPNPDPFEPNDTQELASAPGEAPLAAGVHGYLASVGDVDWYTLTPPVVVAQPIIVRAELRWPDSQPAVPELRLEQGDGWSFVVSGAQAEVRTLEGVPTRVLSVQRLAPTPEPILAHVSTSTADYDDTDGYTLMLTTSVDSFEGATRDDRPESARVFDATVATTAQFEQTLASSDDVDWYRIDLASAGGTHSLLHTLAVAPLPAAPAEPDFLLKMLFYLPTSTPCTSDLQCSRGLCETGTSRCLAAWVQRPARFGPEDCTELCDPQAGGLAPNYLEAQLPVAGVGAGSVYVRIGHITETFLDVPGYSLSEDFTYTLDFATKSEPDAVDASAAPDNTFVTEPLEPYTDLSTSVTTPRPLQAGPDYALVSATSSGVGFVAFGDSTQIPTGTCSPIPLYAFDAWGQPATGTTSVTLSSNFVTACPGTPTTSATLTGPSGIVFFNATAVAANLSHSVQLTVNGVPVTHGLPVVAAAVPGLTVSRAQGGTFLSYAPIVSGGVPSDRSLVVNGASPLFRLSITPPPAASATLSLTVASGNAQLACGDNALDAVPSFAAAPCSWSVGPATAEVDFQVLATSAGPVVLNATATGSALAPMTIVLGAYNGARLNRGSAWTSGYLSYDGDQDFFGVPLPAGFTKGGASVFVRMAASPVDLRAAVARGPSLRGAAFLGSGTDICDGTCISGTCDARNQCTQGALNASAGVVAGECAYMFEPGDLLVWVNEINANDWDEDQRYELQFEVKEGCPTLCSSYMCSQ